VFSISSIFFFFFHFAFHEREERTRGEREEEGAEKRDRQGEGSVTFLSWVNDTDAGLQVFLNFLAEREAEQGADEEGEGEATGLISLVDDPTTGLRAALFETFCLSILGLRPTPASEIKAKEDQENSRELGENNDDRSTEGEKKAILGDGDENEASSGDSRIGERQPTADLAGLRIRWEEIKRFLDASLGGDGVDRLLF
jgi:hypothetical protein